MRAGIGEADQEGIVQPGGGIGVDEGGELAHQGGGDRDLFGFHFVDEGVIHFAIAHLMGQHVDALIHEKLGVVVIVDVREGLHVALVGLIDHGGGDLGAQLHLRVAAVVDHHFDGVGALLVEFFHFQAGDVGGGRVLLEFEAMADGVGAGAFDVAVALVVANFEDVGAVAAHADGGGDAVLGEVAQLYGRVVADVRVGVDDAGDDGFSGEIDHLGAGGSLDFRGGPHGGDASVGDHDGGVGQGRAAGAVDYCGVQEHGLRGGAQGRG